MKYNILNIEAKTTTSINVICNKLNMQCANFKKPKDSLEFLMDNEVQAILINTNINEIDILNFLNLMSQDYLNYKTPIIIISDAKDSLYFDNYNFNILTVFTTQECNEKLKDLLKVCTSQIFIPRTLMHTKPNFVYNLSPKRNLSNHLLH